MSKNKSLWGNVKIEHIEEAIRKYLPKNQVRRTDYYNPFSEKCP